MSKLIVVNASPLIFLSRSNHISLLAHFGDKIIVPEPVAMELRKRGKNDPTVKALDKTPWLEVGQNITIPLHIQEWGLGEGESSVLAYASKYPNTEVIIDDLAGRKCAAFLNIPLRGTLGIILFLKKKGIIPEARPVIEGLLLSGMYLSRVILDEALKRVGE